MDALVISHLLVLLIAMATDSFAQVPTKQPEVVTFSITRSDTFFRPTKVTLSCMSTEDLRDARYLRKLNGQTDLLNIVDENGVETQGDQVTFEVTPDLEGVYFCENGNVTSLNQVEIVGELTLGNKTMLQSFTDFVCFAVVVPFLKRLYRYLYTMPLTPSLSSPPLICNLPKPHNRKFLC